MADRRLRGLGAAALVIGGLVCGGCSGSPGPALEECTSGALTEALGAAARGDTVSLPPGCELRGSFTVPRGVTLQGDSRESNTLRAPPDEVAVRLQPGEGEPARLADVTVVPAGAAAIVAEGSGEAALERVSVRADTGIGVRASGLDRLLAQDVDIRGPVTPANVDELLTEVTQHQTATKGLVLLCVGSTELQTVTIRGFASVGVTVDGGALSWTGGGVSSTRGMALYMRATAAQMQDVVVEDTMQGSALLPVYAGAFVDGTTVETTRLRVRGSIGFGLLHSGGRGVHRELEISEATKGATLAFAGTELRLDGARLEGNGYTAVRAVDAAALSIRDTVIEGTQLRPTWVGGGDFETVEVGDGLQALRPPDSMTLQNVVLRDNERAGAILDLGDGPWPADAQIEAVEVSGTGEKLGFVVQNGVPPEGWDAGIERLGATAANDAAFDGMLPLPRFEPGIADSSECGGSR